MRSPSRGGRAPAGARWRSGGPAGGAGRRRRRAAAGSRRPAGARRAAGRRTPVRVRTVRRRRRPGSPRWCRRRRAARSRRAGSSRRAGRPGRRGRSASHAARCGGAVAATRRGPCRSGRRAPAGRRWSRSRGSPAGGRAPAGQHDGFAEPAGQRHMPGVVEALAAEEHHLPAQYRRPDPGDRGVVEVAGQVHPGDVGPDVPGRGAHLHLPLVLLVRPGAAVRHASPLRRSYPPARTGRLPERSWQRRRTLATGPRAARPGPSG